MTLLAELTADVVLCHTDDLRFLPEGFQIGRKAIDLESFVAFDIEGDLAAVGVLKQTATDDLPRILDRFRLWTPRASPGSRQLLVDALFDFAAPEYELLVHPEQNRENIENLILHISDNFDRSASLDILDFGCGSGLSAQVTLARAHNLRGFDRCVRMRNTASAAGLSVLTPAEFIRLPSQSFHAVFASYVLHLNSSAEDLIRLWTLIRPGGMFLANFHKGYGLRETCRVLTSLGGISAEVRFSGSRFTHGVYWSYVRRLK